MPIKKAFYYSYIFLLLNYTNIYSMEEMSDSSLNADGMSDYSNTSISYEIGDRLEYYVNHKNYAKKSSKKNSKNTPSVKEEDEIPLCLSHRNLTKLPTNINYNVESLDLEYNLLSYIDMEIFTAARLIELNISHNNIEIIPQIQSQSLYYLNISYNGIITLEEFWKSDVKKLQHINVSHNKLKEIHCPSNWDQLRRFNIEGNPATSSINLPNNLSHLIAGASNLQIDSWGGLGPSKQFAELSVYVVTYTKISKPSLIIAPNLQILNLSHNDIKYTHYLHNIQSNNIKILILNNNYIEILHIPDFMPKSLRGIFFQNNCLTDIRQLRDIVWENLSKLKLDNNQITDSQQLGNGSNMPSLKYLSVNNNLMEGEFIIQWPKLQYIDISHNKIESVKMSLMNDFQIKKINVGFNKIKNLDSVKDVFSFYIKCIILDGNPLEKGEIEKLTFVKKNNLNKRNNIGKISLSYNASKKEPQIFDLLNWSLNAMYIFLHKANINDIRLNAATAHNIIKLDLSSNSLRDLNFLQFPFTHLKFLNANYNEIESLELSKYDVVNLITLYLAVNKIFDYKKEDLKKNKLKKINLWKNPIENNLEAKSNLKETFKNTKVKISLNEKNKYELSKNI